MIFPHKHRVAMAEKERSDGRQQHPKVALTMTPGGQGKVEQSHAGGETGFRQSPRFSANTSIPKNKQPKDTRQHEQIEDTQRYWRPANHGANQHVNPHDPGKIGFHHVSIENATCLKTTNLQVVVRCVPIQLQAKEKGHVGDQQNAQTAPDPHTSRRERNPGRKYGA
jgi:hypothetical protein